MRRLSVTTWIVLGLCLLVGVIAVAMTVLVVVRLNRQILASAAELRAGIGTTPVPSPNAAHAELLRYAARRSAIEAQWADAVADYRLRYANDAIYSSVATAETLRIVNQMRRPPTLDRLHEEWAAVWSKRDAALAILARPDASEEERERARELAREATDALRGARNSLRDYLLAQGIAEAEVDAALGEPPQ